MSVPDTDDWDVLVVGAGPAGSSAALAAATAGARVLVVDGREVIGSPVQCAEYLAKRVVQDLRLPGEAISQEVERTITFVMDQEASTRRNPGFIINRDVADLLLARRAEKTGACLLTRTRATGIEGLADGRYMVTLDQRGIEHRCKAAVVVGADGPRSTVGAAVGVTNREMVVAQQVTVELKVPSQDTEVYLDPGIVGGYAWLFPKGELANIGVGVDVSTGASPASALARFTRKLGDRLGRVERTTGGLIPVGGRLPARVGNVLLAGDAAGHTHAVTGGGLHQAIEAGRLAGEAAAAHTQGDGDALERYEPMFGSLFGLNLDRARERRRESLSNWEVAASDKEAFTRLVHRGWIGFPEYYRGGGKEQ